MKKNEKISILKALKEGKVFKSDFAQYSKRTKKVIVDTQNGSHGGEIVSGWSVVNLCDLESSGNELQAIDVTPAIRKMLLKWLKDDEISEDDVSEMFPQIGSAIVIGECENLSINAVCVESFDDAILIAESINCSEQL